MKPEATFTITSDANTKYLRGWHAGFRRKLRSWVLAAALCSLIGLPSLHGQDEWWVRAMLVARQQESQGRYAEAEATLLEVLKQSEQFGAEKIQVATTLNNLGSLCHLLARYGEAERYYKRAISIFEKAYGPEDPALLWPVTNLAFVYLMNGQYAKAESLGQRASALPMELVGRHQTQVTARLLQIEAAVRGNRGEYSNAECLYRQALGILQQSFGADHPDAAAVWNDLGILCMDNGLYTEALSHFQQAAAIWQRTFGPGHPALVATFTNMARLYYHLGFVSEAESAFGRALGIAETVLGPQHRQVGIILTEYAVVLREAKQKSQAKRFEKRAKAIRTKQKPGDLTQHTIDVHALIKETRPRKAKPE